MGPTRGEVIVVRRVGREAAAAVHKVIQAAFGARPPLDPPADADRETPESLAAALAPCGGLLAEREGEPVGALIFDRVGSRMFLRRFGVVPSAQGTGLAHRLVEAAIEGAEGCTMVAILARQELPESVGFWRSNGFREVAAHPPYVEMERPVRVLVDAVDADAMRSLGSRIAGVLAPGDVVVLNGELGAGKTTFTQGLGAGLGVRGAVTSPTFVIARVHPSLTGGPVLVHVDAYRLGGIAELDDLDLDMSLAQAVTVVEWGGGIADGLAESRLEITIERSTGEIDLVSDAEGDGPLDPRQVVLRPIGPRWRHVDWTEVAR